jgi:transcriptional regulator with XRE-family HTH domain
LFNLETWLHNPYVRKQTKKLDMETVNSLIDLVKTRHGIQSDYKLAKFLDMTPHTIANYRHGRSRPDDKTLIRLAELGNVAPSKIDILAAQLQAERATDNDTKALWQRISSRLQVGASQAALVTIVVMVSMSGFSPNAEATALVPSPTKYTSYKVTLRRALFQALRKAKAIMLALSMPPVLVGAR